VSRTQGVHLGGKTLNHGLHGVHGALGLCEARDQRLALAPKAGVFVSDVLEQSSSGARGIQRPLVRRHAVLAGGCLW